MNNAHIESKAVAGDLKGVRSIVRRFAALCLIGLAGMSVAQAGPRDRDRDAQQYQQYQQYQRDSDRGGPQRQNDQRQNDQRQDDQRQSEQRQYDQRAEDQRRNQQMQQEQQAQNNAEGRRGGRLTPDERRDLRRQINEAGADIYPSRTRR